MEEKCRQLEARNQELEKQQLLAPYAKFISEVCEGKLDEARQKILFLTKENKTKSAELKETSAQLQCTNATIAKMQGDRQYMEQKNQALQGMLDEALEKMTQFLCLKKEENTQMQDQVKGIKEKHKVLKVRLDETECKNKELLQEKEQQEEEKRILQDLERRNLQLNEFCNTMKDRTPELEGEELGKLYSKIERRINEMVKSLSEAIDEMLLDSDNLKRENTEMLAQKQQQEKINEDLQRKLQEITRRNEQLEKIHKEKQQQNTDKRNLLKEMEQKNQALQGMPDEALEQITQFLCLKKEGNTQMQDQVKGIKEKHKVLKFRLDETECKIKELLQEKEQQEEEKRILQDLERRNLQLKEFCNTMKDRTPELEGEVLEKLYSKMQRRINKMAKKHSEVKNKILLHSNNLKCKNAEMLAQKQQQEKINEDLQRKLQEITRRNEQLEKIHKEKQQQNTDKRNLLKEMEQKNQALQGMPDEALEQITQFLCLQKEGNTQMQDQVKGIKEKHKVLKVRLDETECKNKELLQEKEQQEEEKRILQDLERRNLQLNEFCNTMKDRTPELEGEVLEKLPSKLQRRINEMLLNSDNLKRENAEMLAQKQQQEKINEDLQRKLQEITRRNEQLEKIHKEKQQQNTDKCNLLKEMEQRCQKLEKEVEETTDQLRTLILEKKVLVEKLMEKKKKRFRFFWRRDTPAFSTFSIFSTADVTSSPSTSVPS
ncbi:unnamed protein product [Oreochromis niloticus]|nr:unnamed protein product [Mustela putorius furo]